MKQARFSQTEKELMLAIKGVGETVILRLEQIGICSFADLAKEDATSVTQQVAQMLNTTCWSNSPLAKSAISAVITLAKNHSQNSIVS